MGKMMGKYRFNRCPHKAVSLHMYYKPVGESGNSWSSTRPENGLYNIKVVAKLDCPRVRKQEIDVKSHACEDKMDAIEDVSNIAIAAICSTCVLSRKSSVQIEEEEARELQARAKRIEAQNQLKKAELEQEKLRELGLPEVQAITAKYGIDPPS